MQNIISVKTINRPLSEDLNLAKRLASKYNDVFRMIDFCIKYGEDPEKYIRMLDLPTAKKIDVYDAYIKSLDVTEKRLSKVKSLMSVLKVLLPNDISKVDMNKLDSVKEILQKMPKRSSSKYRKMDIRDVVKIVGKEDERMSVETLNDHLKATNALMKFAYERDVVSKPYSVGMVKKKVSGREERKAIPVDEIKKVIKTTTMPELRSAYTLLYLTGLRPSEAHKCKISVVDGIKCFDLTGKDLELKTKSSYRLIPVHKLIVNPERLLEDFRKHSTQYIRRKFKVLEGTLYSLRHSFATELASKGVEPHIISELLGHSHKDMTLGRYVKGMPVSMLKDAVDKLVI